MSDLAMKGLLVLDRQRKLLLDLAKYDQIRSYRRVNLYVALSVNTAGTRDPVAYFTAKR
jgi:hypothetical protein